MRQICAIVLTMALVVGCGGPRKNFDGPTVDAFNGKVVQDGKPVSLPKGEDITLTLFHEKGQSYGIPLQPDGSFVIGWMPIGKYTVLVNRGPKGGKGAPMRYTAPGGLTIEDGKTEYTIELGKGLKL